MKRIMSLNSANVYNVDIFKYHEQNVKTSKSLII